MARARRRLTVMRSRLPITLSLLLLLAAGLAGAAAACRSASRAPAGAVTQDTVAEAGGASISLRDLRAEMRRTGKDARAALADLIDFELLAGAAAPSSARDPEVEEARDRAAVQRMIERDLEPRLAREAIPDAVLREVYDKARSVFVHPRLVEVALLSFSPGARMKARPRARALETARALAASRRGHPVTSAAAF